MFFSEVVQHLAHSIPNFKREDFATQLDCTMQTLRNIEKGKSVVDAQKMEIMMRSYGVNPMYLFGKKPMMLTSDAIVDMVNEDQAKYGHDTAELKNCKKENTLLKQIIEDKEKMIQMFEKKK